MIHMLCYKEAQLTESGTVISVQICSKLACTLYVNNSTIALTVHQCICRLYSSQGVSHSFHNAEPSIPTCIMRSYLTNSQMSVQAGPQSSCESMWRAGSCSLRCACWEPTHSPSQPQRWRAQQRHPGTPSSMPASILTAWR